MKSLAIKYRPTTFEDVVEQGLVTKILKKTVEVGKPKNAYLFCGSSGCGKTTLARIFANELNNHEGEPIEIDAASNNGVDQVRVIVDNAEKRSLDSTYKIYIIDECHAITTAGWQAFLKGIEEPAPYTIYIFCTTEPTKVPATILNRVQRYDILPISMAGIKSRLANICVKEGFTNYEDTCELISKICNGCMRDAITTLDRCADLDTDLSLENTKAILGEAPFERMLKLSMFLATKNEGYTIMAIESLAKEGRDLKHFINMYLEFMIDLTKFSILKDIALTNIPSYLAPQAQQLVDNVSKPWLLAVVDTLLELKNSTKNDLSCKTTIEAYLLRICRG